MQKYGPALIVTRNEAQESSQEYEIPDDRGTSRRKFIYISDKEDHVVEEMTT